MAKKNSTAAIVQKQTVSRANVGGRDAFGNRPGTRSYAINAVLLRADGPLSVPTLTKLANESPEGQAYTLASQGKPVGAIANHLLWLSGHRAGDVDEAKSGTQFIEKVQGGYQVCEAYRPVKAAPKKGKKGKK